MPSSPRLFALVLASATLLCASHAIAAPAKRPAQVAPQPGTKQVKDTVGFIQRNMIFTEVGTWGSRLVKGGKNTSIGLTTFGRMADLFFEDRIATRYFKQYRSLYIAGFVTTIFGLAILVTDIVLLTAVPGLVASTGGLVLTTSLLVVGGAMGIVGPILIGAAIRRLMKAVKIFNQGIFSRARQGRWRVSFQVTPGGGVGAGIVGVF